MSIQDIIDGKDHPVGRLIQDILAIPESLRITRMEELVGHEDPEVRVRTLAVCERLGIPQSNAFCVRLLDDPVWHVRMRACEYAQRNHVLEATEQVLNMIRRDENEDARAAAAIAIGTLAPKHMLPQLTELVELATGDNHEGTPIKHLMLLSIAHIKSHDC